MGFRFSAPGWFGMGMPMNGTNRVRSGTGSMDDVGRVFLRRSFSFSFGFWVWVWVGCFGFGFDRSGATILPLQTGDAGSWPDISYASVNGPAWMG